MSGLKQHQTAASPLEFTGEKELVCMGFMSGTSMDGIDAAILTSDGENISSLGPCLSVPYDADLRRLVASVLGEKSMSTETEEAERRITKAHIKLARRLLEENGLTPGDVDLIGFHGQTITHDPENGFTWQLGDGKVFANEIGIPVVYDFRSADVASGGEGAPFAPIYHVAIAKDAGLPAIVLNLGGVGNMTFVSEDDAPIAFDTGPGNALIDDWMQHNNAGLFDEGGALSAQGSVDANVLTELLSHPYFARPWPKSLDRNAFSLDPVRHLGLEDGAATLAAFTAASVFATALPAAPWSIFVTGGGRKNVGIMSALRDRAPCPVRPVEDIGQDGDMLEARAFAYLAVRSVKHLSLSFPTTTGVPHPQTGGTLSLPER